MSRLKIDRSCAIVVERRFPPRDADAPFVAGLQSGKSPFWSRRNQIVSVEHGKIEEFLRGLYTNRVETDIFRAGATKAVAIETGDRIATATFQFASENIGGHKAILTWRFNLLNIGLLKMRVRNECVLQS
jgi:hypothetical protein